MKNLQLLVAFLVLFCLSLIAQELDLQEESVATWYKIVNRKSGKVLEVDLTRWQNNGANVQQWAWNGGYHQQWRLIATSSGYYKIVNRKSGKVLDLDSTRWQYNGANVQQWNWNGGYHQQWRLIRMN